MAAHMPTLGRLAPQSCTIVPHPPSIDDLALNAEVLKFLKCPGCSGILHGARTISPCGHSFCEACVEKVRERNGCPACGQTLVALVPTHIAQEMVTNLLVRCMYGVSYNVAVGRYELYPGGCLATFPLAQEAAHLQQCLHASVLCANKDQGCPHQTARWAMPSHQQECPFVQVACLHREHGCQATMRQGDIQHHLASCPYERVKETLCGLKRRVGELESGVERANKRVAELMGELSQNAREAELRQVPIFVKGSSHQTTLLARPRVDTVTVIHKKIEAALGLPAKSYFLSYQGRVLVDGRPLAAFGIERDSTLVLYFRSRDPVKADGRTYTKKRT